MKTATPELRDHLARLNHVAARAICDKNRQMTFREYAAAGSRCLRDEAEAIWDHWVDEVLERLRRSL